ncbi:hypothetical protein [Herbidospora cretacea]|uniref:hypothetical protein n=1 Tax=Herbidospora cretacea TaxID=28444 RepID=UPI00077308F9|nr:hypothetical protein [Herbidospora cretacea]
MSTSTGESRDLTLLIFVAAITLVTGAIRWTLKRTRLVVVVSGTSMLLVLLTLLVAGYLAVLAAD